MVPLKPAELNGERAEKKTGLSARGSTLTAVGGLPAAQGSQSSFPPFKERERERERPFLYRLSQTHPSLSLEECEEVAHGRK